MPNLRNESTYDSDSSLLSSEARYVSDSRTGTVITNVHTDQLQNASIEFENFDQSDTFFSMKELRSYEGIIEGIDEIRNRKEKEIQSLKRQILVLKAQKTFFLGQNMEDYEVIEKMQEIQDQIKELNNRINAKESDLSTINEFRNVVGNSIDGYESIESSLIFQPFSDEQTVLELKGLINEYLYHNPNNTYQGSGILGNFSSMGAFVSFYYTEEEKAELLNHLNPDLLTEIADYFDVETKIHLIDNYGFNLSVSEKERRIIEIVEQEVKQGNILLDYFSKYLSEEEIKEKLAQTPVKIYSRKFLGSTYFFLGVMLAGGYDNVLKQIVFSSDALENKEDPMILHAIIHESIHNISSNYDSNNNYSGFQPYDVEILRGINELCTDYLTEESTKLGTKSLYGPGVDRLRKLVELGVFDKEDFTKAYLNNDISYVQERLKMFDIDYEEFIDICYNAQTNAVGDQKYQEALNKFDKIIEEIEKQ